MARSVDGFVIPIKKARMKAYLKEARLKAGERVRPVRSLIRSPGS